MRRSRHPFKLSPRQRRTRYLARRLTWAAAILVAAGLLVVADRTGVFGWSRVRRTVAFILNAHSSTTPPG